MLDYEIKNLKNKANKVTGIDEAGRGAWAGPIVVAAVTLPVDFKNNEIQDSKKLTPKKRETLFNFIVNNALSYEIVVVGENYNDKYNPKELSKAGMKTLALKISILGDYVITDYEKIELDNIKQINLTKGDQISICVAAASILAKYYRDKLMDEWSLKYPVYNWDKNKGYGTAAHRKSLEIYGVSPLHRKHYKPIQVILEKEK